MKTLLLEAFLRASSGRRYLENKLETKNAGWPFVFRRMARPAEYKSKIEEKKLPGRFFKPLACLKEHPPADITCAGLDDRV